MRPQTPDAPARRAGEKVRSSRGSGSLRLVALVAVGALSAPTATAATTAAAARVASTATAAATVAAASAVTEAAATERPALALELLLAHVERLVDLGDRLGRLREVPVSAHVEAHVPTDEGDVPVVHEDHLVLRDRADLLVPEGQGDDGRVVADDGLAHLSGVTKLAHDLLRFAHAQHLREDVDLLRVRR